MVGFNIASKCLFACTMATSSSFQCNAFQRAAFEGAAFQPQHQVPLSSLKQATFQSYPQETIPAKRSIGPLHMSSIPEDDEDFLSLFDEIPRKSMDWFGNIKGALPPLPEDHMALSGDVLALFVYSYIDHAVNDLYAEASKMDVADLIAAVTSDNPPSLPVWFDPANLKDFGHWLVHSTAATPPYAPAIASSGLAFVSIATCWIMCGYFSGAFLMRNTLECDTSRAMEVAGKTWFFTAILMIGLAVGSDALWGQLDLIRPLGDPARGGLTKADADYIFDSLTVLAFWRFMFNSLLGYR